MAWYSGLQAQFSSAIGSLVAASGGLIGYGSGYRSYAQQASMYNAWIKGGRRGATVAPPGRSQHGFGMAMDLTDTRTGSAIRSGSAAHRWLLANAARFGIHFPVRGEPWHAELINGRAQGQGGISGMSFYAGMPGQEGPEGPNLGNIDFRTAAKQMYGYLGWYVDHPEIGPIILRAAQEGWTPERLQAELQNTTWWRNTTDTARAFDALERSDPAQINRLLGAKVLDVTNMAGQMGASISTARSWQLARDALRLGWNESQVRLAVAAEMQYQPGALQGQAGNLMTQIRQLADRYFVPFSEETAFNWARDVLSGRQTLEGVTAMITQLSAERFPHLAEQIREGVVPADYFRSHQQMIAQVLEVSPDSIDFQSDPKWMRVIGFPDPKAGGQVRPMSISEAATHARMQPEFQGTRNARQSANEMAGAIAQSFGAAKFGNFG